jgi:hypothetical protein
MPKTTMTLTAWPEEAAVRHWRCGRLRMRHEPFGPERHDHHQPANDSHDGERAERATNQT